MVARSPDEIVKLADEAFNRGDIDGMLAFYEDDAVMLFEPGRVLRGRQALANALREMSDSQLTARHHRQHVIEAGDLALWTSEWTVSGQAHDGSPISLSGRNSVVFRRRRDGGWLVAVENPWGSAILDSSVSTP